MEISRIERVLQAMAKQNLDQMIVSDPMSIWYLTGVDIAPYERLFALLLRADGKHVLFLNNLFHVPETVPAEVCCGSGSISKVWYSDTDDVIGMIAEKIVPDAGLGIDKEWQARFLIPLMERCPQMKPALASDCVDDCRAVKDEREKELMREASRINDAVMEKAAAYVREGMTEKQVAAYIEAEYLKAGSSGPSFSTIVSFGKNAADPHHEPDDTVLKAGECVLIDMGCKKERYCSDMTRTFFCKSVSPRQAEIHDLVRRANEKAEEMIRPGVRFCDIDAAARDLITEAGYGPNFNHRLGHFIGQSEHEKGDVSSANTAEVKAGMIFSIEPGIYLEGDFGVRVEDLVLVTEDGCERLNRVDKHWRIVGQD